MTILLHVVSQTCGSSNSIIFLHVTVNASCYSMDVGMSIQLSFLDYGHDDDDDDDDGDSYKFTKRPIKHRLKGFVVLYLYAL